MIHVLFKIWTELVVKYDIYLLYEECGNGTFGLRCEQKCSINCDSNATRLCHHTTGECTSGCIPGWEGDQCKKGNFNMLSLLMFNCVLR